MNDEIIAIIIAFTTIVFAVIGATWKVTNSINDNKNTLLSEINYVRNVQTSQGVKIDTLWDIYGEEAIRESRTHGFTEHRSPDVVTDKAIALLTDSMYNTLVDSGNRLLETADNPKSLGFQLFVDNKKMFEKIGEENNISLKVFVGITNVIISRCLDAKLGNQ